MTIVVVGALRSCHIFMLLIICFRFASAKKDGSNYFVLLIITDGVITDMPQTIMSIVNVSYPQWFEGAQWLSGRVLDSRPRGRGFEPHWRHCVVVLEQDTLILA